LLAVLLIVFLAFTFLLAERGKAARVAAPPAAA